MARRTVAQRAATARLVAANAARRAGTAIATRASRAGAAVERTRVVTVVAPRGSRRRRVAVAGLRAAGVIGIAQARMVPGALAGFLVAKLERGQRQKWAAKVATATTATKPGTLEDPQNRLLAEFFGLALIASRTAGIVREAAVGAAGALGVLYEMYTAKDGNPVDDYRTAVLRGDSGI